MEIYVDSVSFWFRRPKFLSRCLFWRSHPWDGHLGVPSHQSSKNPEALGYMSLWLRTVHPFFLAPARKRQCHRNRRRDYIHRSSGHQHRFEPPLRPRPKAPPPPSQPSHQTRNKINTTAATDGIRDTSWGPSMARAIECISRCPAAGSGAGDIPVDIPVEVAAASQSDMFRTDLPARGDAAGRSSSNNMVAVAGGGSLSQPHNTNATIKPLGVPTQASHDTPWHIARRGECS